MAATEYYTQDSYNKDIQTSYAGVFSTVVNLLNSILGAGILSIANSFTFCGLIPSVIMITISGVLSYISVIFVIKMHYTTSCHNISSLANMALGRIGGISMALSGVFFCLSCMTAYLIMATDILQSWANLLGFDLSSFGKRSLLVLVYSLFLPIAMTVPRHLTFLSYVSFTCVVSLLTYMVVLVYKAATVLPKHGFHPTVETSKLNMGIFNSLGIYSLAFAISVIIIPIIRHMAPNLKKRYTAFGIAFFISFATVLIPGVCGYLLFGDSAQPLILNNFEDDDVLFIIVRVACLVVLCAGYPVIGLTVIGMISSWIYKTEDHQNLPWSKRIICLVAENCFPLLVAIFLPNVRPVLSIGGALGGGVSLFVLPPIMFVKIERKNWFSLIGILCLTFTTFGIVASAIATYESVLDAISFFTK